MDTVKIIIEWLSKFSPSVAFLILLMVMIIFALVKSKTIIDVYKFVSRKKGTRTCGDCILILFGIREKYETESYRIERNILKSQMSYFEQKMQEVTLWLIQSFQDDIDNLGKSKPASTRLNQLCNYQEAIKNAMSAVKDEVRKAFKENGFVEMTDLEFTQYIKSKLRTLTSIAQSYLSTYYIQNEDTIVSLKYRFDKLDYNRLNELAFDIFGTAKGVVKDAYKEEEEKSKNNLLN